MKRLLIALAFMPTAALAYDYTLPTQIKEFQCETSIMVKDGETFNQKQDQLKIKMLTQGDDVRVVVKTADDAYSVFGERRFPSYVKHPHDKDRPSVKYSKEQNMWLFTTSTSAYAQKIDGQTMYFNGESVTKVYGNCQITREQKRELSEAEYKKEVKQTKNS